MNTNMTETLKSKTGRTLYNPRPHAFLDLLGIQRVEPEAGWDSQTEMVVDERHINPNGAAHGGAAFTLMDACMAGAMRRRSEPDEFPSTIESKINYVKAGRPGMVWLCSSRVVHKGGRISLLEAEIRDEKGDLVAKGQATFTVLKARPAAK
jgi:uncharacterized protein (TIGR00369 family)